MFALSYNPDWFFFLYLYCFTDRFSSLSSLTQVTSRRIANLEKWDSSAAEVAKWLLANRDKFKMEVFLPPCISVSVPDKNYQAAVESCFSAGQLRVKMSALTVRLTLLTTIHSVLDLCSSVFRRLCYVRRSYQLGQYAQSANGQEITRQRGVPLKPPAGPSSHRSSGAEVSWLRLLRFRQN